MTSQSAITTKHNKNAVLIINDYGASCVISKSRYNNKSGLWTGSMQVLSANKDGFYIGGFNYTPAQHAELFPHLTELEIKEIIHTISNFRHDTDL